MICLSVYVCALILDDSAAESEDGRWFWRDGCKFDLCSWLFWWMIIGYSSAVRSSRIFKLWISPTCNFSPHLDNNNNNSVPTDLVFWACTAQLIIYKASCLDSFVDGSPEDGITRLSGSTYLRLICVWMNIYYSYISILTPCSPPFNFSLQRFWFGFVARCPEIGITRLSGSDLLFLLTCVWMINSLCLISSSPQFNYSLNNSDLEWLLVVQKQELHGHSGCSCFASAWRFFFRGSNFLDLSFFLSIN